MKKWSGFTILHLLVFVLAMGMTRHAPQAVSSPSVAQEQATRLQSLVGQKCTVVLLTGQKINGTLWDFGTDFVNLKVKKGLLYSKNEKYRFSEIAYIQDATGNNFSPHTPPPKTETRETKPTPLYFSTGDIPSAIADASAEEADLEHTIANLAGNRLREKQPTGKPSEGTKEQATTLAPPIARQEVVKKPNRTERKPSARKGTGSVTGLSGRPKPKPAKPDADVENVTAMAQNREIQNAKLSAEAKELRILKSQTAILFGAAALIVVLLITFKITGMKGAAYGKYSIFPARMVKLNGKYGIIDQGSQDGVKIDDIIRLYRKSGQKIRYKGKVQVEKLEKEFAAVHLLKQSRNEKLEIGDVGFRDRNFILTSIKRFRIIVSASLRGVAKGLAFTARNLEVKTEEPDIDFTLDDQATGSQISTQEKPATKRTKKAKTPAAQKPKITVVDAPEPAGAKTVGFGLEEK